MGPRASPKEREVCRQRVTGQVGSYLSIAGNLRNHSENWAKITSDPIILNNIKGHKLEFVQNVPPFQSWAPKPLKFSENERNIILLELNKLQEKGVIESTCHSPGEFLSNVFIRPKKEAGAFRVILNLQRLNEHIQYHHFKMDLFESILSLITPNCLMQSVDIKDAYYCVPIAKSDRKYLRFVFDKQLYQYTCIPNGLASGPRVYTKITKPVYATLRKLGITITGYIDDSLIVSDSPEEAQFSGDKTVELFQELGFIINWNKTMLSPNTRVEYLGFVIDSVTMTVTLPERKRDTLIAECSKLLAARPQSIRSVATVIGLMVAALSAVDYGALHYRSLESEKIQALKQNKGDYEGTMTLGPDSLDDLQWWIANVAYASRVISRGKPAYVLYSDASFDGWGACLAEKRTGGRWTTEEMMIENVSINYLEMLAAFLALKSFEKIVTGQYITLKIDNTTAIAYINHMGGVKSPSCNRLAQELWNWCSERGIWLSASHVPGKENLEADFESRNFNDDTEWMLDKHIFKNIVHELGNVKIDLFASRLNHQLSDYVSWRPDPEALYVDAFSFSWSETECYLFPPFSLIARCLRKIQEDEAEGTMVVPFWTTRSWFTLLLKMLIAQPLVIPKGETLLTLPGRCPPKLHPLRHRLTMLACRISGKKWKHYKFLKELGTSCGLLGSRPLRDNIDLISRNGLSFVIDGTMIQFRLM